MQFKTQVVIIGGGLAGCECALTLAKAGINVTLFEQKPLFHSPAHQEETLAELVCSNSLRSNALESGVGLLKQEMRELGSIFMEEADKYSIPAGKALAVDRKLFSEAITGRIIHNPYIELIRHRVDTLDDPEILTRQPVAIVIATGPLASEGLSSSLSNLLGEKHCYFYDAIAPIVWTNSLNMDVVFRASRYEYAENAEEQGAYLNCPMNRQEYEQFYTALLSAEKVTFSEYERAKHFEGCMPIEALAERGIRTLTFGPLKPVGLIDPRTGRRPWAVLQLRSENLAFETCNLVGCQTRMKYAEQERVFRLIPGLEQVEFARFGSMHRNTYVNAPEVLNADLSLRVRPDLFLAGQITGVEGYVESAACGLWLALLLTAKLQGRELSLPPVESALGALLLHLRTPAKDFQPSNVHFGLMPPLQISLHKKERKRQYTLRARQAFKAWLESMVSFEFH